jgi:hypothetical protein
MEGNLLVIISDIHLWDGTIGLPISPQTFSLFASRLRELAYQASWRADGKYRPVESVDILLLGDILDPLQSTRWLDETNGSVRPWSNVQSPLFIQRLTEITRAILDKNSHASEVLRRISQGEGIRLPPADKRDKPDFYNRERLTPHVRIHYMVGNHDWYYHIRGRPFDDLRSEIIAALGLSNTNAPFPHDAGESGLLTGLFVEYNLIARHGDIFDNFTYNRELGRDAAALSDIYSSEVIFRFPCEVERQLGEVVPPAVLAAARQITNIRPVLAAPLWLNNQIQSITGSMEVVNQVKQIWNNVVDEFLQMESVRVHTRGIRTGELSALRLILSLSKRTTMKTMGDIYTWLAHNMGGGERSIARFARREPDIVENRAKYAVYGHTHGYEVVPIDHPRISPLQAKQVYINTGTWGTFYDMDAPRYQRPNGEAQNLVTCLAIYKDGERGGRPFETWWANFS